jgi:4,5-dihydroxyphthalate decarboxylase
VRSLLGNDFWPYGIELNRRTLSTFLAYAHEQGLSDRQLEPDELFPEEVRSSFRV